MEKIKKVKATIEINCEKYSFEDFKKIIQFYIPIGSQKINCTNNNDCSYRMVYRLSSIEHLQYYMSLDNFYELPTFVCVDFKKKES